MRNARLRHTLTCAVLASAVVAGGFAPAASATVDPHGRTTHQHAALPAAPDPAAVLGALGALGGVTQLVGSLASAASATPAPSPADLQAKLTALTAAGKSLTAALPAPPVPVPVPAKKGPADLPPLPVPIPAPPLPVPVPPLPVPLPGGVADALAALQKDATALVAAVTSLDPGKIVAALVPLATDTLAVVTGTVAALAVPPVPVPVPATR